MNPASTTNNSASPLELHRRTATLRRAAVRATLAASIHNTQPWRFELSPGQLEVFSDSSRQLRVLDPTGRQLILSCGCALFNARVSLAAAGMAAAVTRWPDPTRPDLLARLTVSEQVAGRVDPIGALDAVIEQRHTNRRRFSDDLVPAELIDALQQAATAEGSELFVVGGEDDRLAVARLSQKADEIQNANPAYRAELRAWTTVDPSRSDGVPANAVPRVNGTAQDEVPVRDFDTAGAGQLPPATHSSRNQCLLLLGTAADRDPDWLRAGEALERILLEITRHGFVASPLTQLVEVPFTRVAARNELRLGMHPHVLLRVGRAPLTPATRRRRLVDLLGERS